MDSDDASSTSCYSIVRAHRFCARLFPLTSPPSLFFPTLILMDFQRYPALKESIEREQAAVWANIKDKNKRVVKTGGSFGGRNTYGPLLVMLKADKQAVLVRVTTRRERRLFGGQGV